MVFFSYLSLVYTVFTHSFKHTYLHNSSFFLLYSRLLSICTPNGDRTRTTIPGQGILSPSCIPISPSEHLLDFCKLHYFNDCGNSGTRTHTLLKHPILSLAWLPITAYSQISGVRWTQTNNLISMNDAL